MAEWATQGLDQLRGDLLADMERKYGAQGRGLRDLAVEHLAHEDVFKTALCGRTP
ncbi:MAG: hypothetical protein GDA49_04950 [Rhodospirillales bacterium]|nr:hypothetical protein [Rhodospirillales bacterium]